MSLATSGSFLKGDHPVDPEQYETDSEGDLLSPQLQPTHHFVEVVMLAWQLDASYGVFDWMGLELSLPFRVNIIDAQFENAEGNQLQDFDSIHHRTENLVGLGDLSLGLRFALLKPSPESNLSADMSLGVSFPTGNTEPNPFVLGKAGKKHQHQFFGTGIFIPRIGATLNYAMEDVVIGSWINSSISLYENSYGYTPSSMVAGGLGVTSSFGLETLRFLIQQEVFYEKAAKWGTKKSFNSGRTELLASLAVLYNVTPDWMLNCIVKVPYLSFTEGGQFEIPVVVSLGLSYWIDILD